MGYIDNNNLDDPSSGASSGEASTSTLVNIQVDCAFIEEASEGISEDKELEMRELGYVWPEAEEFDYLVNIPGSDIEDDYLYYGISVLSETNVTVATNVVDFSRLRNTRQSILTLPITDVIGLDKIIQVQAPTANINSDNTSNSNFVPGGTVYVEVYITDGIPGLRDVGKGGFLADSTWVNPPIPPQGLPTGWLIFILSFSLLLTGALIMLYIRHKRTQEEERLYFLKRDKSRSNSSSTPRDQLGVSRAGIGLGGRVTVDSI